MSYTTASTSVVLIATAGGPLARYVYLNNISTAGRIVTVRDNDGFASSSNQIIISPANGAYFVDPTQTTITINQPFGFVTFNSALDGGYSVLNTFGFPSGSSAAFVSNITSCNLTTSTINAQFITAPTANFNTVGINTISTGSIVINNFTPNTIAANSISTGSIAGGSASFQTIFGNSIVTNNISLSTITTADGNFITVTASNLTATNAVTAPTGNFTNVTVSNTTTACNVTFVGDIVINGIGTNIRIGSNVIAGTRGIAIGADARSGQDAVSIGAAAGSNNQGTGAVSIGRNAGSNNQGTNAVSIGSNAGAFSQGSSSVAIGPGAGINSQQLLSVAIGSEAGGTFQSFNATAIGRAAGNYLQGGYATACGGSAGQNSQGSYGVALGYLAGFSSQGTSSIAIGVGAGQTSQGPNAIAIGPRAGLTSQHSNTTIINATGSVLNSATANALYIAPIRDDQTGVGGRVAVYYNQTTKEMTTGPATGTNLIVSSIVTSSIVANVISTTRLVATTLQTNTVSTSLITTAGVTTLAISTGTATIDVGTFTTVNTNSLNVNSFSTGSISLATASIGSIAANTISSGTITANSGTISTFTAGSIITNTERVGSLSTNFISANIVNINGLTTLTNRQKISIFVANGDDGAIDLKYSFNGTLWSNADTNSGFTDVGTGVAWNGSYFVATGNDTNALNTLRTSSDGINWSFASTGGFSSGACNVGWNGRMWVAVGAHSTTQGCIQYSMNGSNWSNANSATFAGYGSGIAWGNGTWVATGSNSGGPATSILYSSDGSNWLTATNPTSCSSVTVAFNGSTWLVGGRGATPTQSILASSNGLNWAPIQSGGFLTGCFTLGWNGTMWVAGGSNGVNTIQYSYDGANWANAQSGMFNGAGLGVTWSGSRWVMVGYDTNTTQERIKYSSNGLNWYNSEGSISYGGLVYGVAYSYADADLITQEMNLYSQNVPITTQSTNQILALTSSLVLNNTLYVNRPANYVGINAPVPLAPLHVVGGVNGQTSQIILQTVGSTLNTSVYLSTNVGQATLGVVGPSNGFLTGTLPGDTVLTTARTSNRLVMGNGTQIGMFISAGTVVIPGTLAIGSAISTGSVSTSSASFSNVTFTGDVSIQAASDKVRIGSNAGITGQGPGTVALGAASGQTSQGASAVAIGSNAGQTSQGASAVAIGSNAGQTSQGAAAIAIGASAGQTSQHANTIILNASGSALNSATGSALYVAPIRDDQGITGARTMVYYNQTTKEITTGPTTNLALSTLTVAGAVAFPAVSTNVLSTATVNTSNFNATGSAYVSSGLTLAGGVGYGSLKILGSQTETAMFMYDPGRTDLTGWLVGESTSFAPLSTFGICRFIGGTVQANTGFFMKSNGFVGLRTSNPIYPLDVNGSSRLDTTIIGNNTLYSGGGISYATFSFSTFQNTSNYALMQANDGRIFINSAGQSTIFIRSGNNDIMTIVGSNSNVGIGGITAPATNLVVNVTSANALTGIAARNSDVNTIIGGYTANQGSIQCTSGGSASAIGTTPYALLLNPLGGNVGVGTDGPSYRLDVNGQVWARSTLYVGSNTSNNQIRFYGTSGDGAGSFNHTVIAERIYGGSDTSELLIFKGNDGVNDNVRVMAAGAFRVDVGTSDAANFFWPQGGNPPTANYPNALVVDTNGCVGIGNIAPATAYKLDVNGAIRATTSGWGSAVLQPGGPGDRRGYLEFWNAAGVRQGYIGWEGNPTTYTAMAVEGTTVGYNIQGNLKVDLNVGIGLAASGTPLTNLHVRGAPSVEPVSQILVEGTASGNPNTAVALSNTGGWGRLALAGSANQYCFGAAAGDLCLDMKTANNKIIFGNQSGLGMCLSNNRLGIGKTNPQVSLDVVGEVKFSSNVASGAMVFRTGTDATLIEQTAPDGIYYTTNAWSGASGRGRLEQYVYGSASGGRIWSISTNRLVTFDSNVGIGGITPQYPLHVNGQGVFASHAAIGNNSTYGAYACFSHVNYQNTSNYCLMQENSTGATFLNSGYGTDIHIRTGNTDLVRITGGGRMGIGTTAPGYQLELSLNSAAKPTSGSWTTTSDERAKKNIVAADPFICYSTLKGIPLKYFEWSIYDSTTQSTIGTDDKHSIGFIAQEVEKVFPNAVTTREKYGYSDFRSLDVDQLYKMHYGATQHIMTTIEQQSTVIQTLTSQVTALQETVSTLVGRMTV